MSLNRIRLIRFPESRGISKRWAGVITQSSVLFWYALHKLLDARLVADEASYLRELPMKVE